MLRATLLFFVLAAIAGLFGFGVIATSQAELAQLLFWIFTLLFGVTLVGRLLGDQSAADVFE